MVQIGDEIEITGHKYFPGGDILPIGSVIKVEAIVRLHNAVVYVWSKEHNLDWWILPDDYKIVARGAMSDEVIKTNQRGKRKL